MTSRHPSRHPSRHRLSRRSALAALTAGALTAATAGPVRADAVRDDALRAGTEGAGTARAPRLRLPAPTGPHPVGTAPLHLTDPARPADAWAPTPRPRELRVRLWYPAARDTAGPRAPWMSEAETAHLQDAYFAVPGARLDWPTTHARPGAPADRTRRHPLVLNSHGSGGDSAFNTALAEELASHGHIVAAVDHTFDAGEVEFPGPRLEVRDKARVQAMTDAEIVAYRAADMRCVLDRLEHGPLPAGLDSALDLDAVGMFGHSMGGATTAQAMHDDGRIRAGAVLDGPLFGTSATADQPRPLLLMASAWDSPARDTMWDTLWPHLTGWRRRLTLTHSGHLSYTDLQLLIPQGQAVFAWPADQLQHFLGTGDPRRAVQAQRAYLTAYFGLHLRGTPAPLLDAPSPRWPEVVLDA
ncbi:alpha/beta hydrolase family protein [Kitasatospora xanthocidica]|uniref:alpha/beta hydrolase family protein n=1 Tax=Kitasatospora xanthocidica TaxID=83382 RepID=UPI0036EB0141